MHDGRGLGLEATYTCLNVSRVAELTTAYPEPLSPHGTYQGCSLRSSSRGFTPLREDRMRCIISPLQDVAPQPKRIQMKTTNQAPVAAVPLSDYLCFAVYSANLAFGKAYKPILEELGLTYTQYITIIAIDRKSVV